MPFHGRFFTAPSNIRSCVFARVRLARAKHSRERNLAATIPRLICRVNVNVTPLRLYSPAPLHFVVGHRFCPARSTPQCRSRPSARRRSTSTYLDRYLNDHLLIRSRQDNRLAGVALFQGSRLERSSGSPPCARLVRSPVHRAKRLRINSRHCYRRRAHRRRYDPAILSRRAFKKRRSPFRHDVDETLVALDPASAS